MESPAFNHFVWQVRRWDVLNFIIPKLRQNQKVVMQKRSKWKVQHCVHFVWQLWHWTGLKSIGFNSLVVLLRVLLLLGCKAGLILDCSIALHRAPGVESDYTIQHALEPQHPIFRVLVWCSHPVICCCPRCPHPIVSFLACMVAFTRDSVSMFTQPSSCSRTARAGKHLRFELFQLVAQMWNCGEVVWI